MLTAVPLGSPLGAPVTIKGRSNRTRRLATASTDLVSPLLGCFIVYEIGIARGHPILG